MYCFPKHHNNNILMGALNVFFLFSFPKDPDLTTKWLTAVKRKNFNPGSGARLCSKLFTKDQFQLRPNVNFLLIKPGAAPSIFDFLDGFSKPPPKKKKDNQKSSGKLFLYIEYI